MKTLLFGVSRSGVSLRRDGFNQKSSKPKYKARDEKRFHKQQENTKRVPISSEFWESYTGPSSSRSNSSNHHSPSACHTSAATAVKKWPKSTTELWTGVTARILSILYFFLIYCCFPGLVATAAKVANQPGLS